LLLISKILGASGSYFVAKYILSDSARALIQNSDYLKGLKYLITRNPIKYGIMIRMSPIPVTIRNYGLAVLPINLVQIIVAVALQGSFTSFVQASMGA
jgi:uncharacterized membrane protein YdjX (TVP38/TMEM64 family)